jgi:hypothetical protein
MRMVSIAVKRQMFVRRAQMVNMRAMRDMLRNTKPR